MNLLAFALDFSFKYWTLHLIYSIICVVNIINLLFHDQSGLNLEIFFEFQNATLIVRIMCDGVYLFIFYFLIRLLDRLTSLGSISIIPNLSMVSFP